MSDRESDRLAILQTVRLKGRADVAAVAGASALDAQVVSDTADQLVGAGLLRVGPTGLRMTEEGRDALADLLAAERDGLDVSSIRAAYERFCPANDALKQLMTDWQMLDESTPNDHSDADYDAAIAVRLAEIDAAVGPVISDVAESVGRLSRYRERLAEALARVEAGDHTWISKPIIDSYHTVWFELHEELIGAAGLSRQDEAAAGRAS